MVGEELRRGVLGAEGVFVCLFGWLVSIVQDDL